MVVTRKILESVAAIADAASERVMERWRGQALTVTHKQDQSPVSCADIEANRIIVNELTKLLPGVPVLSEEMEIPGFDTRKKWPLYWLVDPLDGTRSFIRGGKEFTINIALIDEGKPVLGVVSAPAFGTCYLAATGLGAFVKTEGRRQAISTRKVGKSSHAFEVLSSHRQVGRQSQVLTRLSQFNLPVVEEAVGSCLKICRVAEGQADIVTCFVPTKEWDTAAAQVIVEQSGGALLNADSMDRLVYNRRDSLVNPGFFAIGDISVDWNELFKGIKRCLPA